MVTPRDNGGEFLCATEGSGLRKDVDGVLLGVGGDDELVVRRSEGRVSRAVQKNVDAKLEHGVQLALTNNLQHVVQWCACNTKQERGRTNSIRDGNIASWFVSSAVALREQG